MVVGRGAGTGVEVGTTLPVALVDAGGLLDSTGLFEVSGIDNVGDLGTGWLAGVAGDVQAAINNKTRSPRNPRVTWPVTFRLVRALSI